MKDEVDQIIEQNPKEARERTLLDLFRVGKIKFQLVTTRNGWSEQTAENILHFKAILQKQLPKMPREYIFKQIFNEKHHNILCFLNDEIIGGVCYRPFYEQNFIEIVFLAVEANLQVSGHGSMIIDLLKEHIKREIQKIDLDFRKYLEFPKRLKNPIYIMAYADNYAIGFFKKQGFSTDIYFNNWQGYIKDYEGGTLVQCKVLWEINYLRKMELIEKKRVEFVKKMSQISSFNILRGPVDFANMTSVWDITGLKEAKFTEEMLRTTTKKLKNVFRYILSDIRSDSHAWPFVLPVNAKEVPDYYQIIKYPMDLSTIEKNIENDKYQSLGEFEEDFRKIFTNCYTYNAPNTTYCKCAYSLEQKFEGKLKEVRHVFQPVQKRVVKKSNEMKINLQGRNLTLVKKEKFAGSSPKKSQDPPVVFFDSNSMVKNPKIEKLPKSFSETTRAKNQINQPKEESEEDDIFNIDMMDGNSGDFF